MSERLTLRERIFGSRETEDRTLTPGNVPSSMLDWAPVGSVTPQNALSVADAFACIRALSDAAASLPLHVYRHRGEGRERVDNATAELIRRPAPATTTANLIGQIVAHLSLHGNAFIGIYRRGGRVEQRGLLAPDRVAVAIDNGEPVYTITDALGRRTKHGTDDVIHVRAMGTDGLVGISPVRQCRVALGLAESLTDYGAEFFNNAATPRGLLTLQKFGDAEAQVAALREGWEGTRNPLDPDDMQYGTQRGTANAHRIAVVSGEVDFKPISMPLDDAQFLESRRYSAVEIARIFRVPSWIVNADSGSSLTYSNTEQQALHFVTYSLRPHLVLIEQALSANRDLFPGSTYCEFALDALLRADSKTRAEVYRLALDPITGYMNRDEVRRLENLPVEPEIAIPRPTMNGNGAVPTPEGMSA